MTVRRAFLGTFFILGLTLLVIKSLATQGTDKTPDLTSLSDADIKTVTIQLERIACYGTCPAYSLTIHGDGRVEYNGKSNVKDKGTQEGRVETAAVKALLSEFAKARFFSLAEDYSEGKCARYCTDMTTVTTELGVKGMTHRVKHYYGCGDAP